MIPKGSWAKERKIGAAGLIGVVAGWAMLLYVQTLPSVCAPSVRMPSRLLLLICLASPVTILWAAIKDKWWWAIGLIPAILLLWGVLGTFVDC
jgi:hypothetical protein